VLGHGASATKPRPLIDLLAVRGRDGAALVLAVLCGHGRETLSFTGVMALAVVLDRFTGSLSLTAVHTYALHLIGAGALIGSRIHVHR
jgi:hypothetical protein